MASKNQTQGAQQQNVQAARPINIALGPDPQRITCPFCHENIQTQTKKIPNFKTHVMALLLCVFGCFFGCCLIPYFVDSCLSTRHNCPNCGAFLGNYQN